LGGLRLIHQTGEKMRRRSRPVNRQAGVPAEVAAFFRDMPDVYGRADLVVSRAGATTLSELAVLGLPALLVPYPFAADNHQEKNAEYYVRGGGALMVREKDLTADLLAEQIGRLAGDQVVRAKMGAAMRQAALPEAAQAIVAVCRQLISGR